MARRGRDVWQQSGGELMGGKRSQGDGVEETLQRGQPRIWVPLKGSGDRSGSGC